jgi:hypothetical protein
MQEKRSFTMWTFMTCFLFNTLLVAAFYVVAVRGFQIFHQSTDPLLGEDAKTALEDVRLSLANTNDLVEQSERYLAPAVFGSGGLITLLLWLTVQFQGRRLAGRISAQSGALSPPSEEPSKKAKKKSAAESRPSPTPAVQMLSLLQRQGRFVDFLQEDLRSYEDAQIGAAVRSIHEGCKKALSEHVALKPVFEDEEGGEVTVQPGFDAHSIRLTGNVKGDPPFQGTLRHRGWKVTRVELPQQVSVREADWILAPAEVEIDG